jgi:hypothetical protein
VRKKGDSGGRGCAARARGGEKRCCTAVDGADLRRRIHESRHADGDPAVGGGLTRN